MEGQGSSDEEYTVIESTADSLDSSVIFHVINDVVGFVLYMYQQIPSTLQDISLEFDTLHSEYTELEMDLTAQTDAKAVSSLRRKHMGRMREVKRGIRRLEKLMNAVSSLQAALKLLMSSEIANIREVVLVLGASPIRPLHVYQLCFSHGKVVLGEVDFAKSRAADGLSRKVIRTLISKGAGSGSYPGPSKLFLLVKAPSSFNLPLHFLPKRDFRYSKKIVPFRLRLKCKTQDREMGASQTGSSISLTDSASDDLIWFQCRHVIKGLASNTPTEE
ncbi:uncharacterized protein LOC133852329 isoform X2 [Alnus glutinosa]|uniref:uncharacterized protein LOC133852329 isoform X2 n=1 Tax=Alnus glutinosa TaxID=3517 RepID=UPI002D79A33D|nr:uncharacterized protein LOC133852329 isoform X2 [Alnus glutinosa]